jgi:hypothetical protein
VGIVLVLAAVLNALGSAQRRAADDILRELGGEPFAVDSYRVTYRVSGSGLRASLTYNNAQENTEQQDVSLNWEEQFDASPGQFLYVSAQSDDNGRRSISCSITVNGVVVEQAESTGEYVIATCSGSVP